MPLVWLESRLGAIAPFAGVLERIAFDEHAAHAHLRKTGSDAIADAVVDAQRFIRGQQRFIESAGCLEDRGAPIQRRGQADLRLLLAEERDGFVHQQQRLWIVAHRKLRHGQAAGRHHGFFAAGIAAQQRVGAQQVVERLVRIAIAEVEPAAVAQQATHGQRPIGADGIDDPRELDRGRVDAAHIGGDQRAHRAHAHRQVRHVTRGQQREAGVGVGDGLPAEAELARRIRRDGVQSRAPRGRHVGGRGNRGGELRQGRGGIAERERVDGGEIAGLRADAGRMSAGKCSGQRQEATDTPPDLPG